MSRGVEMMLREAQKTWHAIDRDVITLAMWGLMHDAAEAYCGDVIWPVKQDPALKAAFKVIEDRILRAICDRFGLPCEQPVIVAHCDQRALATEKRDLMPKLCLVMNETQALREAAEMARTGAWHCDDVDPFEERIESQESWAAEDSFLDRDYDLRAKFVLTR